MIRKSSLDTRFSPYFLSDFGTGTGIALLGFRAHAFGQAEGPTVRRIFRYALGIDADVVSAQLYGLARIVGTAEGRRVALSPPGCCRMTPDEVSLACALGAAQAQDLPALEAHLRVLVGGTPPRAAIGIATDIGDAFAVNGHVLRTPNPERRIAGAATPAFAA